MANSKNENGVIGFAYLRPPDKTTWEKITTTLYDKTDNTILGRTPLGWGKLLTFYTIFYIVLAALFAICMQGLFAGLNDQAPKWTLDESLIGTNPGMGFRPISNDTDEGSLIWYDTKNVTTREKWVKYLNEFLAEYTTQNTQNQESCDFEKGPSAGKVCEVDLESFGECSQSRNFGYNTTSPCIFLKLNRIFDWQPLFYNNVNDTDFPTNMPQDLVEEIEQETANGSADQIWVSCVGEHPVDQEHLLYAFQYYPTRGFAGYYYPFTNIQGYLSPLVAVRVINPTPNVMISIECRAWAKNIRYSGSARDREGSVHFEIMVDV